MTKGGFVAAQQRAQQRQQTYDQSFVGSPFNGHQQPMQPQNGQNGYGNQNGFVQNGFQQNRGFAHQNQQFQQPVPLSNGQGQFRERQKPITVWPRDVVDCRHHRNQDQLVPIVSDSCAEFITLAVHDVNDEFSEWLEKDKIVPVFAEAHDSKAVSLKRMAELSNVLDLSMEDDTWNAFMGYLKKNCKDAKLKGKQIFNPTVSANDVPMEAVAERVAPDTGAAQNKMMEQMMAQMMQMTQIMQQVTTKGSASSTQALPSPPSPRNGERSKVAKGSGDTDVATGVAATIAGGG